MCFSPDIYLLVIQFYISANEFRAAVIEHHSILFYPCSNSLRLVGLREFSDLVKVAQLALRQSAE